MGVKKTIIAVVWFILILISSFSSIVLASSSNWVHVATFTRSGTISYTTDEFTCSHVEWRIIWEYVPYPQNPNLTSFSVFAYPPQSGSRGRTYIDSILKYGVEETKGISIIDNYQGTFTLNIIAFATESFKINIEQNIDSIPEFPSWTIFILFLITTLVIIVNRKRLKNNFTS